VIWNFVLQQLGEKGIVNQLPRRGFYRWVSGGVCAAIFRHRLSSVCCGVRQTSQSTSNPLDKARLLDKTFSELADKHEATDSGHTHG
jgi:hypothetical protein